MDFGEMNKQTIKEFRTNQGLVGGMFKDTSLLLLHHFGAKSGTERVSPLGYRVEGDTWVVLASKAGAPTNPDWYYNLLANPATTIEVGTETVAVNARVAQGTERARIWEATTAEMPIFAEYEAKSGRKIPVVVLERSSEAGATRNRHSFSTEERNPQ